VVDLRQLLLGVLVVLEVVVVEEPTLVAFQVLQLPVKPIPAEAEAEVVLVPLQLMATAAAAS
jgi:hypothetical protein